MYFLFFLELKIFYSINSLSSDNPSLLPSLFWETCKAFSRGLIMSFVASKRRRRNEQHKLLESRLADLDKHYISSPSSNSLKKLMATCAVLNTLLIQNSEYSLKVARQRLYEHEDKPGRYLAKLVKRGYRLSTHCLNCRL